MDARSAPGGEEEQRIRDALLARRREVTAEVTELAEPIRAPGVQVQFGKRAGDHTSDAVMQMTRSMAASELSHLTVEIDRALEKLDDGTYGTCDGCGEPIGAERLEALPWAVLCVSCKAAGVVPEPRER
jgi:DnaK suppressor protein